MNYQEAIRYLYDLRRFGTKLGLEQVRRLAGQCGHPQESLSFVHVAGTNGKGSVCAMLESVYRAAGLRVGLFTSPHLVSFRERIQVGRRPIPEDDLVRLVAAMKERLNSWPPDHNPTFFEVVTVIALQYFAEQQCDLVVWETGLGGRLDATNLVRPRISVITSVGLDHQQWLGYTLEEVAREKAGIIKKDVPVVTAAEGVAREVIETVARNCGAPIRKIVPEDLDPSRFQTLRLGLAGQYQWRNAAVAVSVIELMQEVWPVSEAVLTRGLATTHWPGRLQEASLGPGRRVLLDGAHNLDGFTLLRQELEWRYQGQPWALVMGVLEDKDWGALCRLLAPLAARICVVPVKSMPAVAPDNLAAACRHWAPQTRVEAYATVADALETLKEDPLVVVTGSLYLVGEAMAVLGLSALPPSDESLLNEASFRRDPRP